MPNLSWLFYKGYYENFNYWLADKKKNEKEIERFFTDRNRIICESRLVDQRSFEIADLKKSYMTTTYPGLLVGSGYTHEIGKVGEIKLGFQFDYTTGMPVIPGSSVKGIIRSAFPQFVPGTKRPWEKDPFEKETEIKNEKAKYIGNSILGWKETGEELYKKVHRLEQHLFEGLNIEESEKNGKAVYYSLYKRDLFYDAFPTSVANGNGGKLMGMDSITPHPDPLKNPIPLAFIKILPNVIIQFQFVLRATTYLEITSDERMKIYHTVINEFGVGAKTNVGYGQFKNSVYQPEFPNSKDGISVELKDTIPAPRGLKMIKPPTHR